MKKVLFASTLSLVILAACKQEKKESAPSDPIETYRLQLVQEMQSARGEIPKEIFAAIKLGNMRIPRKIDFYPEQSKEKSTLDEQGKKNFELLKEKCQVQPKQEKREGEYKAGHTSKYEDLYKVSGANCPLSLESSYASSTQVIIADADNKKWSLKSSQKSINKYSITQPELFVGNENTVVEHYQELPFEYSYEKNGEIENLRGKGNGIAAVKFRNGLTGAGTISMVYTKQNKDEHMAMLMTVKFPSGELNIGGIKDGDQTSIYVNGKKLTEQEYKDLFGSGLY